MTNLYLRMNLGDAETLMQRFDRATHLSLCADYFDFLKENTARAKDDRRA